MSTQVTYKTTTFSSQNSLENTPVFHPDFTGKEKDSETGYYYFGARYYNPDLSLWLSVDPMADKYPSLSPYNYCAWNPMKLVDPDGRWVWNRAGNLVAQKGDDINTMSAFLGTSVDNCATILNRCGLVSPSGINITSGCTISSNNLWIDAPVSNDSPSIDNTLTAVMHYFGGDGEPVNIGDVSTSLLFNTSDFRNNHKAITNNSSKEGGSFSVNMTGEVFHIGRTTVSYEKGGNKNTSTVTYKAFSNDGFWDPAFLSEKTLGKVGLLGDLYKPDGKGGRLEMGGIPYDYNPRERTFFYKPTE